MRIGKFYGVQVTLNWLFVLLLLMLAAAGLLAQAVVVFVSVLLHELAHVVATRSLGLAVAELELLPFGGVARIDDLVEVDPAVEVQVALAGPVMSLLLVALCLLAQTSYSEYETWLELGIRTNVALAVFNLLPALPLDGGRVFRAFLTRRHGFREATRWAVRLGKGLAILFTLAGVVGYYYGYVNMTLIVAGFFVYAAAAKEQRTAMYVLIRYLARKQEELQKKRCLPVEQLVAVAQTTVGEVVKHFLPQRYHMVWIIDHKGAIAGMLTEMHLLNALFDNGFEITVGTVLAKPAPSEPISPD